METSTDDTLQYTPNRNFLLDHDGKLSTDDSEPIDGKAPVLARYRSRMSLADLQRIALGVVVIVFAVFVTGWMGWRRGRDSAFLYAIHGPSMAPTLIGEHRIASCVACGLDWPIGISDDDGSVDCFHCGDQAQVNDRVCDANVVMLHAYDGEFSGSGSGADPLRSGDVVAIDGEEGLRIKRIAGVPGDTVELDGTYLLVNGKPVLQSMASETELDVPISVFPFEMDRRRAATRWTGKGWKRSEQRSWESEGQEWLVYHHQSIHQGNQPSRLWDDYPYNVGLSRKLQPVQRIVLSGLALCQGRVVLEAVFWIDNRAVAVIREIEGGCEFNISSVDAMAAKTVPIAADAPVAIRVLAGSVRLSCLQLSRQIEYRLRPHDDHTCYPMELGSGEYFVVGDNVPVSLDSRNFGVIQDRDIKGRVALIDSN